MNDILDRNLADIYTRLGKLERRAQLDTTSDKPGNYTAGSVLFGASTGNPTQDNANLFWDDTNNRLGLGLTTPLYALDIEKGFGSAIVRATYNGLGTPANKSHSFFYTGDAGTSINATMLTYNWRP